MKVLVSDSSILIEFAKRELLDKMFALDFEFAVPDLLFHEELINLASYSRQDLLGYGLRVEASGCRRRANCKCLPDRATGPESRGFICTCACRPSGMATPDGRQAHAKRRRVQRHRMPGRSVGLRQYVGCRYSVAVSGSGCARSDAGRPEMPRS